MRYMVASTHGRYRRMAASKRIVIVDLEANFLRDLRDNFAEKGLWRFALFPPCLFSTRPLLSDVKYNICHFQA